MATAFNDMLRACELDDRRGVVRRLRAGADPFRKDACGRSALNHAVGSDAFHALDAILRATTARSHDRVAALSDALVFSVYCRRPRAARMLLRAGADPAHERPRAHTALIASAHVCSGEVMRELLNHARGMSAAERRRLLELRDDDGMTALLVVCDRSPPNVRALVDAGADVLARDARGRTPFSVAMASDDHVDLIPPIAEALAAMPPGPRARVLADTYDDAHGFTALHSACNRSCVRTVGVLLELGARTDLPAANGWTALRLAEHRADADVLRAIREHAGRGC